jgi:hypothetical protein
MPKPPPLGIVPRQPVVRPLLYIICPERSRFTESLLTLDFISMTNNELLPTARESDLWKIPERPQM